MYQVTWHVFEAVICPLCWLDNLDIGSKVGLAWENF
jgi:hypothetical protein